METIDVTSDVTPSPAPVVEEVPAPVVEEEVPAPAPVVEEEVPAPTPTPIIYPDFFANYSSPIVVPINTSIIENSSFKPMFNLFGTHHKKIKPQLKMFF